MKPKPVKQSANATTCIGLVLTAISFLVAALIVIAPNSPNYFHSFIARRVIPGFEGQRQQGDQFAVLLLIPESDLNNINLMSLQPLDNNQQPLVNKANCYCPNRQRYRNYVAARPRLNCQGTAVHSEITLLQELPHLWEAFVRSYGYTPSYVILYSWMMPCPYCTERICQTLQNTAYENTSVIVAYTIDWKKISVAENKKSRDTLQAAGIKVEQVRYDSHLPPAQDCKETGTKDDESSANSLAGRLTELRLQDTCYDSEEYDVTDSEEYDVTDSEEYDVTDSEEYDVTDSEEYDVTDSEEYYETTSEEYYGDSDEEEYTSEQQTDGSLLNGLPPVGQDGLFPEVPVRRKPPQAQLESRQEDDRSPTGSQLKTFLRLLSTNADDQCNQDSEDDGNDFTSVDEPPDRYKLT